MSDIDSRNEDMFKDALKELVLNEPEKLEFFDGIDAMTTPPVFVPTEANAPISISLKRKRRQYACSMAAVAACFIIFISLSVVGMPLMSGSGGGSSLESPRYDLEMAADSAAGEPAMEEQAAEAAPEAPAPAAEAPAMAAEAPAAESDMAPALADDSQADETQVAPDVAEESREEQEILAAVESEPEKAAGDTDSGSTEIALVIAIICAIAFVILMVRYRKLR